MHGTDNRVLAYAALASVAFHALLLIGWPRVQERLLRAPAPPIVSRLAELQAVAEPAPAPAPKHEAPSKIEKTPKREKQQAAPPSVPPRSPIATRPAEQAAPPPVPAQSAPQIPADAAPAPSPAPAAVAPPGAMREAGPPADDSANLIARYRLQVLSAARRLDEYPARAKQNGWSGRVVVSLAVDSEGQPRASLKRGSSYAGLDAEALQMFLQAARAVPLPAELRGKAFVIELAAVYAFRD